EQLPDRDLQALALEVPERDVDRADGARDDVPPEGRQAVEVLPVVLDPHGVLADQVWREGLDDLVDGLRVAPGRALADAAQAVVGRDADVVAAAERQGLDALDPGHGLPPISGFARSTARTGSRASGGSGRR